MSRLLLIVMFSLFFIGCENAQFRGREKGALAGGALGAGLGAIIGHKTGETGAGIAIGTALGALTGGALGNQADNEEDRANELDRKLSEQQRELEENRRILEELRGRGADVRSTERGIVVNLPDVLFNFDRSDLTGRAQLVIEDIVRVLRDIPERRISVEGHTDSVGTAEYNQQLSQARARSVSDQLIFSGLSRSRISTRGFGEMSPIASNQDAAGRARNRRVEVIIENR